MWVLGIELGSFQYHYVLLTAKPSVQPQFPFTEAGSVYVTHYGLTPEFSCFIYFEYQYYKCVPKGYSFPLQGSTKGCTQIPMIHSHYYSGEGKIQQSA